MSYAVVVEAVSTKVFAVGIQHHLVGTLRHNEAIVGIRAVWREVEHKDNVATHVSQHLVAIVVPNLLHRSLIEIFLALYHLQHLAVEVAKIVVVELLIVNEVPLAACILMAPAVAFAREINPLRVSKLIAHEVEVATINGRSSNEANHLVKSNTAACHEVFVALLEVPIHVGIDEAEDDGLVAHQSLVVAFAIRYCLFVATTILNLPEYRAWLPVFVLLLLDGLNPIVWNVHRHAVVETVASILEFSSQSRHSAHLFGYGDSLWIYLVDKQVGKGEIADGVVVLMTVEIVLISAECFAKSVAIVKHRCHSVEAETIEMEFVEPVFAVREQEVDHLVFAIVEA